MLASHPAFRRACVLLACCEVMILLWVASRFGEPGSEAMLAAAVGVCLFLIPAWRPLWRSTAIRTVAMAPGEGGHGSSGSPATLRVWYGLASDPVTLRLRWCWVWGERLVVLGLGEGSNSAWALVGRSANSVSTLAQFHRTLRAATADGTGPAYRW